MEVVLVCADEMVRASLGSLFKGKGFNVKTFSHPKDVSKEVSSDTILISEHSPNVDCSEYFKKAGCVIAMVHPERAQDIASLKDGGVFDAFLSPVAPGQLTEALNRFLDGKKKLPLETKVLERDHLSDFISAMMAKGAVYAPVMKEGRVSFEKVEKPSEVKLAYTSTILPPKKLFQPTKETVLRFNRVEAQVETPMVPVTPKAVLGVHPCDMQGILRTDWAFSETNPEENYLNRRKETVFIGVSCCPDEHCFCQNLGTYNTREGFDAFMVDLGNKFVVEILTEKAKNLLSNVKPLKPATKEEISRAAKVKRDLSHPCRPLKFHPGLLPKLMEIAEDDRIWFDVANRCYSCGTCTLVCPSCYCFDVEDDVSLSNLSNGERIRLWDSCQSEGFALVATGENFRKERSSRVKHRVFRKYYYLANKYGDSFCVGCGRCARQCTAGIDIFDIVSTLSDRYALTLSGIAKKMD